MYGHNRGVTGGSRMHAALAEGLARFGVRVSQLGSLTACRVGIAIMRSARVVAGRGTPLSFAILSNIGVSLERLHKAGDPRALDGMVAAHATAYAGLGSRWEALPQEVTVASNLGSALLERFELQRDPHDLRRARAVLEAAADACADDHPDRVALLMNLAVALSFASERGDVAAGEAGLTRCAEAAALVADADPLAADVQTLWGQLLQGKAEYAGDPRDLEAAIQHLESAVERAERTNGDLPHARTGLARAVGLRGVWENRGSDLKRSSDLLQEAIDGTPADHVALRLSRRASRAIARARRYQWTKDPGDLDDAVADFEDIVTHERPGPLDRANLAVCLVQRADTSRATPADLDRAIDLLSELVAEPSDRGEERAGLLAALADALLDRAEWKDSREDLASAKRTAAEAVSESGETSSLLAHRLSVLGEAELAAFNAGGVESDRQAAQNTYAAAFASATSPPRDRIHAALLWGHTAALGSRWAQALEAHDHGNRLIPLLLTPDLRPRDGLRLVEDLSEAGPDVLALSLMADQPALGLARAEQWRGFALGPDRRRREEWRQLRDERPDLHARLRRATALLDARATADSLLAP